MRYYLDTNILVFLRTSNLSEISREVQYILQDYDNRLYTSSVCIHELIHLCQIGKVSECKGHKRTPVDVSEIILWLNDAGIKIQYVSEKHLQTLAELPLKKDHHDPFDRLIIAQAIADGISIITSDRQFAYYQRYGLKLMFNER